MTRKWFVAIAAVFLVVVLSLSIAWAVFDTGPRPGGSFKCTTETDPEAHC